MGRPRRDADDRPRLRVPGDHPRDGGDGLAGAEHPQCGTRDRDRRVADVRPRRAWPRSLAGRRGVRPRVAAARLVVQADIAPRRPAEPRRPGRRAGDARSRQRDPAPRGTLVSRTRGTAARPGVGLDGLGRNAVLPVLVDGNVPGARDLHRRDRVNFLGDSLRDRLDPRGVSRRKDQGVA